MASKSDQLGSDVAVIAIGTRASRQEWVARGRSNAFVLMMKRPKDETQVKKKRSKKYYLPGRDKTLRQKQGEITRLCELFEGTLDGARPPGGNLGSNEVNLLNLL